MIASILTTFIAITIASILNIALYMWQQKRKAAGRPFTVNLKRQHYHLKKQHYRKPLEWDEKNKVWMGIVNYPGLRVPSVMLSHGQDENLVPCKIFSLEFSSYLEGVKRFKGRENQSREADRFVENFRSFLQYLNDRQLMTTNDLSKAAEQFAKEYL